jgi:Rps23 Pro-64 3,4-dihydroxylase Tpa1-like proline 4-hydroxylase
LSVYLDTLLCHDDELEDRRVAFIYYLVPVNWTEEEGGSLDMFNVNGNTLLYMKILSKD